MISLPPRPLWAGRTLALIGIVLVAFNLRTAVASLSPILGQLEAEMPLAPAVVGFLGMLPPLCYALFGILTPMVAKRLGLELTLVIALVALSVGLAGRGLAGSALWLVAASAVTFAAIGVGNVLLPPLVKRYFPDRIGLVTTIYVTAMSVSTFTPPLVAVPVADAAGWRVSLGEWAFVAAISLVPWIAMLLHPKRQAPEALPEEADPGLLRYALRSPLAWSLTIVFAVSGFNAYAAFAWLPTILHDIAGVSPAEAGALLSLYAAMGLPAGLLVPLLAARYGKVGLLVAVAVATFVVGYLGLLLVPGWATWLWVALAGIGPLLFPLALVLINLRTRTHAGSVALSGFVQSGGYLIVAVGPLVVGLLHEATGGWTWPILFLLASAVPAAIAGVVVARPQYLEDERTA
ncbi:CP family cyanate transporter-like MFS transporter [Agromyces hippuratus]|uniref:CP family cyanate transporter-like MFS transporter n=1 Tax=Agromyces hippuratus TaxID=286438 RepID=A0A852WNV8_9MICO|nr:MFS transporter [Agromyces hippuratus]NYG19437.1 CP family cyanate transporter-like MFS transporter [Agromyces hippuratus]